jgi:hypothetical protein
MALLLLTGIMLARYLGPEDCGALLAQEVLLTARISEVGRDKGYDRNITSVPRVRESHSDVLYVIPGDDNLPRLRALVEKLALMARAVREPRSGRRAHRA